MTVGKSSDWATKYFGEGDAAKIQQAVARAEQKTAGDIVPMVVHRSAGTNSVAPTLFLLFLVLNLLLGTQPVMDRWDLPFVIFALISSLVSLALALALAPFERIQRLVIPKKLLVHEVHTRAELEFYRNHFDQTKTHGAVLIFISLLERQVVVLCDPQLAVKIPQAQWDAVASKIAGQMKSHGLMTALLHGIEHTGSILSPVLPSREGQSHEIPTDFIIKE